MAINLDAIGKKIGPLTKSYTWKDVVLYALGVGAGFDELEYVYEQRLKVIPSFSIASVFEFLYHIDHVLGSRELPLFDVHRFSCLANFESKSGLTGEIRRDLQCIEDGCGPCDLGLTVDIREDGDRELRLYPFQNPEAFL